MKAIATFVIASLLAAGPQALASSAGHGQENPPAIPGAGAYTPGLGEIMGGIQLRHAKLWFAGEARNWELASYELGEIREAFEDAAKYQPAFKGRPIAQMIDPVINPPSAALEHAIKDRNPAQFSRAFDQLSSACVSCHRAAGYGFIVIRRPSSPPFTNQQFDLPH